MNTHQFLQLQLEATVIFATLEWATSKPAILMLTRVTGLH